MERVSSIFIASLMVNLVGYIMAQYSAGTGTPASAPLPYTTTPNIYSPSSTNSYSPSTPRIDLSHFFKTILPHKHKHPSEPQISPYPLQPTPYAPPQYNSVLDFPKQTPFHRMTLFVPNNQYTGLAPFDPNRSLFYPTPYPYQSANYNADPTYQKNCAGSFVPSADDLRFDPYSNIKAAYYPQEQIIGRPPYQAPLYGAESYRL